MMSMRFVLIVLCTEQSGTKKAFYAIEFIYYNRGRQNTNIGLLLSFLQLKKNLGQIVYSRYKRDNRLFSSRDTYRNVMTVIKLRKKIVYPKWSVFQSLNISNDDFLIYDTQFQ